MNVRFGESSGVNINTSVWEIGLANGQDILFILRKIKYSF